MRGVNFRIYPDGRRWAWQVLGAADRKGFAQTRAEAAAYVIREAIRSVVPVAASLEEAA